MRVFAENRQSSLWRCRSGAAAVELALVSPILIALLFGAVCWGGYFWMAHDVQQLANDGARAAVAGLDQRERREIAEGVVREQARTHGALAGSRLKVRVEDSGQTLRVAVTYDASGSPFLDAPLVPMPSAVIERAAVARLGGF